MISNKGNGLDSESGIFKAPVPGFYFITFLGESLSAEKGTTSIYFYKDSNTSSFSFGERNENEKSFATLSGNIQFKLEKYDTVKIKVKAGKLHQGLVYFSGYLIEETI